MRLVRAPTDWLCAGFLSIFVFLKKKRYLPGATCLIILLEPHCLQVGSALQCTDSTTYAHSTYTPPDVTAYVQYEIFHRGADLTVFAYAGPTYLPIPTRQSLPRRTEDLLEATTESHFLFKFGVPLPMTSETVHASISHLTHSLLPQEKRLLYSQLHRIKDYYNPT